MIASAIALQPLINIAGTDPKTTKKDEFLYNTRAADARKHSSKQTRELKSSQNNE